MSINLIFAGITIVLSAHVSIICLILGLYSTSDVAKMLAEIAKMEDLRHPNVMSLIGVHLDMRLGLSIVMPFMANGSLLEYLKRERNSIYLDDSADVDTVSENENIGNFH